jgi:hypothetical protein
MPSDSGHLEQLCSLTQEIGMNTLRSIAITGLAVAHFGAAMAFGIAGDSTAALVQLGGAAFWAAYGLFS